jgi:hypothetical protein
VSFLTPFFLLGGLAVALPVLFHLIRRATRQRTRFSSLMFLTQSPPRLTQRSRLEHILLLLLRCAVVCLLALAFARPFFRKAVPDLSPSAAGRLVVLVDTSASMRRANLWAAAREQVQSIARQAAPADQVAVFTFDRQVNPVVSFEQWTAAGPGQRVGLVAGKLAALSPGWSATHLGQALIQAAETLAEPGGKAAFGPGRIVLISDMQEGCRLEPLQGYEWPRNVRVSVQPLKSRPGSNAALQLVSEPDEAAPQVAATIRVRVTNAADSRRDQFRVGWAQPDGRGFAGAPTEVYVPPGQSRVVPMPLPQAAAGQGAGPSEAEPAAALARYTGPERILLQGDDEDFDNTVFVVAPETQRLSVLYCGSGSEKDPAQPLYFLRRAFQETRRQAVQVVVRQPGAEAGRNPALPALSAADLQAPTLFVVADPLPEALAGALRGQVAAGKTALFVLRSGAPANTLATVLGRERLVLEEAALKNYAILGEIDFRHPLFAPFADPRFNDFSRIHFWKYRRLDAGTIPSARPLAKFDSGDAALIEVPVGRGRVLILTSGWHPEDSQLALSTKFVPLLYAMLEHSGAPAPLPAQYHVDDIIPIAPAAAGDKSSAVVRAPDGSNLELSAAETNFSRTLAPGIYTLVSARAPRRFAVNLDAAESRTAPLPADELERLGVPLARQESAVAREAQRNVRLQDAELENRQRLWRLCLIAALGVLLVETWVAAKMVRAQFASNPASEGGVSSVEERGTRGGDSFPRPSTLEPRVPGSKRVA